MHRVVMKVKNQHLTGSSGPIFCHLCDTAIDHAFLKKHFIGFSVRITCPQCGWMFEG